MTVKSFTCTTCGDILYGRAILDSKSCHCGRAVLTGTPCDPIVTINDVELVCPNLTDIEISNANPDVLYWDWNLQLDQFGVITEFSHTKLKPNKYTATTLIEL